MLSVAQPQASSVAPPVLSVAQPFAPSVVPPPPPPSSTPPSAAVRVTDTYHEAHCKMGHLLNQQKLAILHNHLDNCRIDATSEPVKQCVACVEARMRRRKTSKQPKVHQASVRAEHHQADGNDMFDLDEYHKLFSDFASPDSAPVPVGTCDAGISPPLHQPHVNVLPPEYDHAQPLGRGRHQGAVPVKVQRDQRLRPFELLFVDNKAYPCKVIGGRQLQALVIVDAKTGAVFKHDVTAKTANGKAFRRMAAIWGLAKLPYPVTVYTDGCGSMVHVHDVCTDLGLNYQETPPYDQSFNRAELAIQMVFGAAGACIMHGHIDPYYYPYVVNQICNIIFIAPSTAARQYESPHQAILGTKGDYSKLVAPGSVGIIRKTVKNATVCEDPDPSKNAEPGRVLCNRNPLDSTHVVLVKRTNRYYTMCTRHFCVVHAQRLGGPLSPIDQYVKQRQPIFNFPYHPDQLAILPGTVLDPNVEPKHTAAPLPHHDSSGVQPLSSPPIMPSLPSTPKSHPFHGGAGDYAVASTPMGGHMDNGTGVTPAAPTPPAEPPPRRYVTRQQGKIDTPPVMARPPPAASTGESSADTESFRFENQSTTEVLSADTLLYCPAAGPDDTHVEMGSPNDSRASSAIPMAPSPPTPVNYGALGGKPIRQAQHRDQQHACAQQAVMDLVNATPSFELDISTDGNGDLAYILDAMERREEQALLQDYLLGTVEPQRACYQLAQKATRKWRRKRVPLPPDPKDWMGPIQDMPWRKVLNGPRGADAIAALNVEIMHLVDKILIEIPLGHELRAEAEAKAQPGRFLLDLKRSGKLKARGVQQGHLEDRSIDGETFNYFSRVADLISVRACFFHPDRQHRDLLTIDVSHAFLQSTKFGPDEPRRFIKFKHPVTCTTVYYLQTGPIYGSGSAPSRWSRLTLAPWLKAVGFISDPNDPCIFTHRTRDIRLCIYCDDTLIDVKDKDDADAQWFVTAFCDRFECNEPQLLAPGSPIDFLGLDMHRDSDGCYISMATYVHKSLHALGAVGCKEYDTPISKHVTDTRPLDRSETSFFMTGTGCMGWLAMTGRPDLKHAHSRLSQHLAKPTQGALQQLWQALGYLNKYPDLCLAQIYADLADYPQDNPWRFYVDADHATNPEPQNKRRSQYGALATIGKTPIYYTSNAYSCGTSVEAAKAHSKISGAHATTSSGESEVYAMGSYTKDLLVVSYRAEALGIPIKYPMLLNCDNAAAEVFQLDTAAKSTLKHIDCRQQWVQTMRDHTLFWAQHVDSADNLGDFFTKMLSTADFVRFRDCMMIQKRF